MLGRLACYTSEPSSEKICPAWHGNRRTQLAGYSLCRALRFEPVRLGAARPKPAWNVGRKVGPKRPLRQKEVWAIHFWLEHERSLRDRALFDLAIDSKLRGCDLVRVRIDDVLSGNAVRDRTTIVQRKTGRPVQFEILEPARSTLLAWLERRAVRWRTSSFSAGSTSPSTCHCMGLLASWHRCRR